MIMNKGGDKQMETQKESMESDSSELSYLEQCVEKLDGMIESGKVTKDDLVSLRDMLVEHQSEMSDEYGDGEGENMMENEEESKDKPSIMIAIGKAMKKGKNMAMALVCLFTLLGVSQATDFSTNCWVNTYTRTQWKTTPYNMSRSTVVSTFVGDGARNPVLSTYPCSVSYIAVTSAGVGNFLTVYDSTSPDAFDEKVRSLIMGTSLMSYSFSEPLVFDKGLVIRATGTTMGIIQINWRER